MREALTRLVGQGATLDTVELEVNPPYARDSHHAPEGDLAEDDWQG